MTLMAPRRLLCNSALLLVLAALAVDARGEQCGASKGGRGPRVAWGSRHPGQKSTRGAATAALHGASSSAARGACVHANLLRPPAAASCHVRQVDIPGHRAAAIAQNVYASAHRNKLAYTSLDAGPLKVWVWGHAGGRAGGRAGREYAASSCELWLGRVMPLKKLCMTLVPPTPPYPLASTSFPAQ